MSNCYQAIPDFYRGQCIFITGVTGFLGKVLLEKLLRSCSDVNKIYVLMRPKRGQAIQDRLDSTVDIQLFDRLRSENPNFLSQVKVIAGDLSEPTLGISDEDMQDLIQNVNIIFHSAATVRFDEPLKQAIQLNLEGVRMILELSKKIENLRALVHVSTAYCNCDRSIVDEVIYPPPLHPQKLLDAFEWMDEDIMDQVTPRLIGDKPNTYTYTKQMAEYLISEQCGSLPVAIVRPSIVCATWKEPLEGWVDNFNGPTGLMAAISKGLLRSMLGNKQAIADLIPVDSVVNTLLAVGWQTALSPPSLSQPTAPVIYNCTTGQINRYTWGMLEEMTNEFMVRNPTDGCVRLPKASFTRSATWHQLNWILDHHLPACLLDLLMTVTGKRAFYVRYTERISKSLKSVDYFTSQEWTFSNHNLFALYDRLSPADKKEFDFDIRKLHWPTYIEKYALGIRKFALKEDLAGLEKARANIRRLQRLSFFFNTVLVVVLWRILVKRVKVASNIWALMLRLASSIFQKIPNVARS